MKAHTPITKPHGCPAAVGQFPELGKYRAKVPPHRQVPLGASESATRIGGEVTPDWRNGSRASLKMRCLRACRFDSCIGDHRQDRPGATDPKSGPHTNNLPLDVVLTNRGCVGRFRPCDRVVVCADRAAAGASLSPAGLVVSIPNGAYPRPATNFLWRQGASLPELD